MSDLSSIVLNLLIDISQTQLIAIVPEDVRIAAIAQRGNSGRESVPSMAAFVNLAARIEGQNPPLAKKILGISCMPSDYKKR